MKTIRILTVLSFVTLFFCFSEVVAVNLNVSMGEIAQTSDLIFVGTVKNQECHENESKSMIFTTVYFEDIDLIHKSDRAVQTAESSVEITYAGGKLGDRSVFISGSPNFVNNRRYLLFVLDNGKTYANPVIGGNQGIFEIIKDKSTAEHYPITPGKKAVIRVDATGITLGRQKVSHIADGSIYPQSQTTVQDHLHAEVPIPTDNASSATVREIRDDISPPVLLEDFLEFVTDDAMNIPLENKLLRFDGQGSFIRRNGMKFEVENLQLSKPTSKFRQDRIEQRVPMGFGQKDAGSPNISVSNSMMGGTLGACGYQDLHIVMEQVDAAWWSYPINDQCMASWNNYMDIFRFSVDDGTYGDNSENEFCGFVSDSDLNSVYGFNWGSGIAMCITWQYPDCGEITQSDVMWNSSYTWTSDPDFALGNSSVILLRPVNMHELGHCWGYMLQSYTETYDYDHPSVMHSYYSDIVEDGCGIHTPDAYLIRAQYDDQSSIINIDDIGVESYYASNGLINSTTNKSSYVLGESITIENVTVENMSNSDLSDVRIRFYLSTDRNITTADYQMGGYWYWVTFTAEAYNTSDYTMNIPASIPSGDYFIGMIVTINGFGSDDFSLNDTTSLFNDISIYAPPVPDFTATPVAGVPPLTVDFSDMSTGDITSRLWTFGDGETSSEPNPTHIYEYAGTYDVSLTASGPGGSETETKYAYIFVNTPPVASNLKIVPEDHCPLTEDDLVGSYEYYDADGDPEGSSEIQWYQNNIHQAAFDGSLIVDAAATAKHQCWRFTVKPHDGKEFGNLAYSDSVCICNTPPVASELKINPENPDCSSDLVASYRYNDADNDSDTGTKVRWYRNDIHEPGFDDQLTVPGDVTVCCDTWYFTVEPYDGEDYGELQTSSPVNVQMQLVLEAEDMEGCIAQFGSPCTDGWNIKHPDHPIYMDVDFPQDYLFHFKIRAKGEIGNHAAPWMKVRIGDDFVGTCEVSNTEWQDHEFSAFITGGMHQLSLSFLNDWWSPGKGDRNLLIDRVEISCQFDVPPMNSFVIEAENMGHQHPKNYQDGDNMVLHRPYSFVSHDLFLTKEVLEFEIIASGQEVDGIMPEMNIKFDDEMVTSTVVSTAASTIYKVNMSTSAVISDITEDVHRIKIEYKSDSWASGRNLLIDKLIIHTNAELLKENAELQPGEPEPIALPAEFALEQNYPNPFNPETYIEYQLPHDTFCTIRVMNMLGQEIKMLQNGMKQAGYHSVIWDGTDNAGSPAVSGIYFYRIEAGEFISTRKMILLK
ncbi:PKD domain-containing protein [candidate division KSB1 bacterium]|nr:PKD domain-containing protein [candidate division KSB1 bacterium]